MGKLSTHVLDITQGKPGAGQGRRGALLPIDKHRHIGDDQPRLTQQVDRFQRAATARDQTFDHHDALNEWTTAIGSAEFAVLPGFSEGGWLGQRLLESL